MHTKVSKKIEKSYLFYKMIDFYFFHRHEKIKNGVRRLLSEKIIKKIKIKKLKILKYKNNNKK